MDINKQLPGWEAQEVIGTGGFGKVYKIRKVDTPSGGTDYYSALKVITIPQSPEEYSAYHDDGYDDKSITEIFKSQVDDIISEFAFMSQFRGNSNIVSYEDHRVNEHPDGLGWDILIRMELLTSLPNYLNSIEGKALKEGQIISLGKDICRALELCASKKIVHRDIKPQNIFISPFGDFKLGDFGIARTMDHTTRATKIGTYEYMSPEVYRSDKYNSAADIYSLGLVLYWLLNERRLPFLPLPPQVPTTTQKNDSQMRRLSGVEIVPPLHGSEKLKQIVLKACSYDPAERYDSAKSMREALMTLDAPFEPLDEALINPSVKPAYELPLPYIGVAALENDDADETESAFGHKYIEKEEETESTFGTSSRHQDVGVPGVMADFGTDSAAKSGKTLAGVAVAVCLLIGAAAFFFLGQDRSEPENDPSQASLFVQNEADPQKILSTTDKEETESTSTDTDLDGQKSEDPEPILYDFSIEPTSMTVLLGNTQQINAVGVPDATDIEWISSDSKIVTIENGIVSGNGQGSADITAKCSVDGKDYKAVCNVKVIKLGIALSANSFSGYPGETTTLSATTSPAGQQVQWSSSNANVATVSGGTVTAVGEGSATITAAMNADGKDYTSSCTVSVKRPTITLSKSNVNLLIGDSLTLNASASPSGSSIKWSSSDTSVVSVTNGNASAVGAGSATISASMTVNGQAYSSSCAVNVTRPSIGLNRSSMELIVGDTDILTATTPQSNNSIQWSSSNSKVAVVNNGRITATGAGSAIISAIITVNGTDYKSDCTVYVEEPIIEVELSFDANGGYVSRSSKSVIVGEYIDDLPIPTRDYYTFDGWYTSRNGGGRVNSSTVVDSEDDFTIYAHWTENSDSGWILASSLPGDAKVVDEKWTYDQTNTITSDKDYVEGYTLYDTKSEWGAYGNWSKWSTNEVSSSDSRDVETRKIDDNTSSTMYWYWRYLSPDGKYMGTQGWNGCTIYQEIALDYPLSITDSSLGLYGPALYEGGYASHKNNWFYGGEYQVLSVMSFHYEYRYRDRSLVTTYYHQKTETCESASNPSSINGASNVQKWVRYIKK